MKEWKRKAVRMKSFMKKESIKADKRKKGKKERIKEWKKKKKKKWMKESPSEPRQKR